MNENKTENIACKIKKTHTKPKPKNTYETENNAYITKRK